MTKVEVPGVAEGRPPVKTGDAVHVIPYRDPHPLFEGRILDIEDNHLILGFGPSFERRWNDVYDVNFVIDRQVIKRMHLAIRQTNPSDRIFFPSTSMLNFMLPPTATQKGHIRALLSDTRIASNEPQLEAVTAITLRPSASVPYIIFGP